MNEMRREVLVRFSGESYHCIHDIPLRFCATSFLDIFYQARKMPWKRGWDFVHIRPPETNVCLNRPCIFPHFKASIAAECEAVKSNHDKYDIIQTLENFLRRIQMIAVEVKLLVEAS